MIKSGYGSDTEEEEEQEDEKYSEEDLTEQSLKERKKWTERRCRRGHWRLQKMIS